MGFLAYAHLDEERLPSTEDKEDWFDNDWEDFEIRQKVIKTIEDAQRLIKTKTESGSTFLVDGIQEHQWIRDLYENIKENVDPSAESTLLADVYAALKRAHDGPTNGRPAKQNPFPVNLPRRDNPDTQTQPENRPPPVNIDPMFNKCLPITSLFEIIEHLDLLAVEPLQLIKEEKRTQS
jgi:hypothetical protein